jgi:glutathione peroxidase
MGFPANDFGAQEPGTNEEIKTFCSTKYDVTFPMFAKVSVKGADKAPLFEYLTSGGGNSQLAGEIDWNFEKFLVGKDGRLIARFGSRVDPASPEVASAIEAALRQ